MRRHIIWTLGIVSVYATFAIFGDYAVEGIGHVGAHIFVPVLVQRESARCVLDEEVQETRLVVFDLWELFDDGVCDEVGAARARGECELFLEPVEELISSKLPLKDLGCIQINTGAYVPRHCGRWRADVWRLTPDGGAVGVRFFWKNVIVRRPDQCDKEPREEG
jgi:hypothetical protein